MKRKIAFVLMGTGLVLFLCLPTWAEDPPPWLATWGSYGTGDGQFNNPWGVAVDSMGNVYVADKNNFRIQKFDSDGNFLTKWGTIGTGDGEFNWPFGIAVDSLGNVFVADTFNCRIQKFDSDGNFLTKWGTCGGTGDGKFNRPVGVAVNSIGNVYVADTFNHRIQKFDSDGNFLTKWGTFGTGDGEFSRSEGVAVDAMENVYVADRFNHRIQKFDSDGSFLTKWGTFGTGDGQFNSTYGVGTDSAGNVYVADGVNHRIQKFDSDGNFLTKWGTFGTGDGQFNYSAEIAADNMGNVYVADYQGHRIQKFGTDADWDGHINEIDNCPSDWNPSQVDTDADSVGDLCDICPADQMDSCDAGGSTAEEIDSDTGGTVETPDGSLNLDIEPGDLGTDETISVTQTVFNDPEVDLALSLGMGLGQRILVYDLQPDGLDLSNPITITIEADVSGLNENQRNNLALYQQIASGDLEPIPSSSCVITTEEPPVTLATCTAEISHFSIYALVAPLDSDGDGVPDLFGELRDGCPFDPLLVTPDFDEFLPPIGGADETGGGFDDPIRTFKRGSTVPIKFRMYCEGNPSMEGNHTLKAVKWSDGTNSDPPVDATPQGGATSGNEFVLTGQEWHFNLDTRSLTAGQWEFIATLEDGTQHNVWVQLR